MSGTRGPSRLNEDAFERAIEQNTRATCGLVDSLEMTAPPRNRKEENQKALARHAKRFGVVSR